MSPDIFEVPAGTKKNLKFLPHPDKLYFLNFDAANQVVDVFINRRKVGTHIGGYSSFSFDVSDFLNKDGENNLIEIRVDNSHNEDIPPLSADFNFFGGIYRDLSLEIKISGIILIREHLMEKLYTGKLLKFLKNWQF